MKKTLLILATAFAIGSFAGNPDDNKNGNNPPDTYCAEFRDGVLHVTHDGKVLTEDAHLANGVIIHTDAVIQKANGAVTVMKPEQCVSADALTSKDESKPLHKAGKIHTVNKKVK
jgi:hypothetical protein